MERKTYVILEEWEEHLGFDYVKTPFLGWIWRGFCNGLKARDGSGKGSIVDRLFSQSVAMNGLRVGEKMHGASY